jgi:Raf kinase inhibitor-like YbhB/YbcL family protein
VLLLLAACTAVARGADGPGPAAEDVPTTASPLVLTSPDVDARGAVPEWGVGAVGTSCSGPNRSPSLDWSGAPTGTRSFAVTMTNTVAPSHVSWVVTGIPAGTTHLDQADDGHLTTGVVGTSLAGEGEYVGPCRGGVDYTLTLYALGADVTGTAQTDLEELATLVDGHVLATATLVVRRPGR